MASRASNSRLNKVLYIANLTILAIIALACRFVTPAAETVFKDFRVDLPIVARLVISYKLLIAGIAAGLLVISVAKEVLVRDIHTKLALNVVCVLLAALTLGAVIASLLMPYLALVRSMQGN